MNGKVELSEMWGRLMTLLMWPWPLRMFIRWMLIRWSWLGRYSLIGLIFFMNIIIIKIVFEQLPNFPFLRCVNRLPIGVDDLVNIGLNFFLPIRFFLPGLVLLAMSSKSSHFLCTEILEQDRDVGIRSTSLNLYFSQVIGIHRCIALWRKPHWKMGN